MKSMTDHTDVKRIAIIGAGATGLTAAYELLKQYQAAGRTGPKFSITIYEASERAGGHIKTEMMPNTSLFYEAGAELIAGIHRNVLELAEELGVEVQAFKDTDAESRGGEEAVLFYNKQQLYSTQEFEEEFQKLAPYINADEARLYMRLEQPCRYTRDIPWNMSFAKTIDAISLKDYILGVTQRYAKDHPDEVAPWAIQAILTSYAGEIGDECSQISALTFICMLNTSQMRQKSSHLASMAGEEEGAFRMRGGNETLIQSLLNKVQALHESTPYTQGRPIYQPSSRVTSVHSVDNRFALELEDMQSETSGTKHTETYDYLISAINPGAIKQVKGLLETLNQKGGHHEAVLLGEIQESNLTKVSIPLKGKASEILKILSIDENYQPSNKPFMGILYTDQFPQTIWVTSAGQKGLDGTPPDTSILTCYISGTVEESDKNTSRRCKDAIYTIIKNAYRKQGKRAPEMKDIFDLDHIGKISAWDGHNRGCFVSPGIGQFMPLMEFIPHHKNLSVVGSFVPKVINHTMDELGNDVDVQIGYMNNAVAAGQEAARHIYQQILRDTQKSIQLAYA